MAQDSSFFGNEKISRILIKIAPPVMLAQLIQALYNIIDSFFVGKYSETGLTALSIIYPLQLLMIAIAVGTGVGINTCIAHYRGLNEDKKADDIAGIGTPLAVVLWLLFAAVCYIIMPYYARMSTASEEVINEVIIYGRIVCVFSTGLFAESIWTKILQADGDMKTPMYAQIAGAITNIILDPILIFGMLGLPAMGIAGAAIATVAGQFVAAVIVMKRGFRKTPDIKKYPAGLAHIYKMGIPNILMQSAYTFYILGLNLILSGFSDQAVTALGLYYKWQTFFFIPLGALQTCIVPILSYNYAKGNYERCRKTMLTSLLYGFGLMFIGTLCFEFIPTQMIKVFSSDINVIEIGTNGFRIIGVSFIPMVTSLIFPVYFQAIGRPVQSSILTIVRTVVLFVPLGYLFAKLGLLYFWFTYPITELITSAIGGIMYKKANI